MPSRRLFMIGMAILVVAAGSALADLPVVVYEDVAFIEGTDFSNTPFMVAEYGLYEGSLTDFEFPEAFEELGMSITTAGETLGSLMDPGRFQFVGYAEESYYVNLFGIAGAGFDLGLYGVEVILVEAGIPEPATLTILAIGGLVILQRRRFAPSRD